MVVVLCCKARCLWDDAEFKETGNGKVAMLVEAGELHGRLAAAVRGRDSLSQLSRGGVFQFHNW